MCLNATSKVDRNHTLSSTNIERPQRGKPSRITRERCGAGMTWLGSQHHSWLQTQHSQQHLRENEEILGCHHQAFLCKTKAGADGFKSCCVSRETMGVNEKLSLLFPVYLPFVHLTLHKTCILCMTQCCGMIQLNIKHSWKQGPDCQFKLEIVFMG